MRQSATTTVPPAKPAAVSQPPPAKCSVAPAARATDEDPFAIFGGPPLTADSSGRVHVADGCGSGAAAMSAADIDDSFLAAFAPPVPQQPTIAAAAAAAPAKSVSNGFDYVLGCEGHEMLAPAAAVPISQAQPGRATHPSPAAGRSSGSSSGRQGLGMAGATATRSFGYEQPGSAAAAPGQSRYRVFDYVQPEEGAPAGTGEAAPPSSSAEAAQHIAGSSPLEEGLRMSGAGGCHQRQQDRPAQPAAGILHADGCQPPPQNAKEAVSDLGQKAAKALQSGTKWFMKASKTLVTQVQQRLEHHGGSNAAAGQGGWTALRLVPLCPVFGSALLPCFLLNYCVTSHLRV